MLPLTAIHVRILCTCWKMLKSLRTGQLLRKPWNKMKRRRKKVSGFLCSLECTSWSEYILSPLYNLMASSSSTAWEIPIFRPLRRQQAVLWERMVQQRKPHHHRQQRGFSRSVSSSVYIWVPWALRKARCDILFRILQRHRHCHQYRRGVGEAFRREQIQIVHCAAAEGEIHHSTCSLLSRLSHHSNQSLILCKGKSQNDVHSVPHLSSI